MFVFLVSARVSVLLLSFSYDLKDLKSDINSLALNA